MKILLTFFVVSALLIFISPADALVIETKIGTPLELSSDIITWGRKLADTIGPYSGPCYYNGKPIIMYNVLTTQISNNGYTTPIRTGSCGYAYQTFFCTDIVISSYNLAGFSNSFSRSVFSMVRNWADRGWTVLKENNQSTVSQLRPGDVFFMGSEPDGLDVHNIGHRHVIEIDKVNIDPTTGWGSINYVQSNGPNTRGHLSVKDWVVKHNYSGNPNGAWWIGLAPR